MSAALNSLGCTSPNATECILIAVAKILQQVEDANDKLQQANDAPDSTNLDKANFAMTTVIGVVALFFTVITIFQGLLAAGPGRLKCNAFAIGSWAKLSSHRFNRSELRLRSTAYTPVINTNELLSRFWFTDELDAPFRVPYQSNGKVHTDMRSYWKSSDEYFPATWLALLTSCGLHHPGWWASKPQSPNYLPAEFNATPAYSTVNDLIRLASLCNVAPENLTLVKETASDGPAVRSSFGASSFQLDIEFRRHPILGTYATILTSQEALQGKSDRFEEHLKPDDPLFSLPLIVQLCIRVFGWLLSVVRWDWPKKYFQLDEKEAASLLYTTGDIPRQWPLELTGVYTNRRGSLQIRDDFEALKSHATSGDQPVTSTNEKWQVWDDIRSATCGPLSVLVSDGNDGGFHLLAARFIETVGLFPWERRKLCLQEGLMGLLCLSRFCLLRGIPVGENKRWKHSPKSMFEKFNNPLVASDVAMDIPELINENFEILADRNKLSRIRVFLGRIDSLIGQRKDAATVSGRILSLAYASAVGVSIIKQRPEQWHPSNAQTAQPIDLPNFDQTVGTSTTSTISLSYCDEPLTSVMARLLGNAPEYPAYYGLYPENTEALSKLKAEKAKLKYLWEYDHARNKFKYETDEVQHPLDDLLIYRAILVAVYLKSVPDNTKFLENPAYNKLIPVL